MTLIEVLVATSLMSIALTLITMLVISLAQTFTSQEAQHDNSTQASLGMQRVGQVVRAAVVVEQDPTPSLAAFDAATPTTLTMHGYFTPGEGALAPTRVILTASAGRLLEQRFAPRVARSPWDFHTASTDRVLVPGLLDSGASFHGGRVPPVFRYLRADGGYLPQRALSETERAEIAAVEVSLVVQLQAHSGSQATQIVRTFALPNLDVSREVG